MNTTVKHARWSRMAATGALVVALAATLATPALAAAPAPEAARSAAPVPQSARSAAGQLPPLDREAIRRALPALPDADLTGALLRVTGSAGRYETSWGTGDLTTGRPVDVDGRFRIGSISKVFTAAVVLQLAAEHRIDVDAPVQRYLPGVLPAGWPPITIGQLLNHTSGLPGGNGDAWGDGTNAWFVEHRTQSITPQEVVAGTAGQQLRFAPGSAQQYNGMNTFVLGLLVEQVTGHSYAHEVQQRIIRPLGLRDTAVPAATDSGLARPAARVYLTVPTADGGSRPVDVTEQSPWPWAEGGLISSAPDLDRFFTALFEGRLLPGAQQRLLFTVPDVPNRENSHCATTPDGNGGRACMSAGLEHVQINGVDLWGKTGSRPGWTSGVFATRDLGRKIVYSLNPTDVRGANLSYVLGLADAVFPAAKP
ncbi:serine hydrolase domain-containing protein [Kitasatospora sp. NPDC049258]|uniref:serine hydrolase domain-containing protein n=1 Tax=Kitasatospora sp. NPDC049258 TaxID=3155394 RepID=UPI00342DC476